MKVYFVRHAESTYNKNGIFQGQANCPLSKKGLADTLERAKSFPQDFDVCFCSPLDRAKNTAELLVPDINVIYDVRLKERGLGEYENTIITSEKRQLLSRQIPLNGETFCEFDFRITSFLEMIKKNYDNKKVLVVTHGGVICAIQRLLGLDISYVDNLETLSVEL